MKNLNIIPGLTVSNKPVILTNHALDQAYVRCGIKSIEGVCAIFTRTREFELPPQHWAVKFAKYGRELLNNHFFYDELSYTSFTLIEKEECFLIVTIVKKKYKNIKWKQGGEELKPHLDNME